MDPTQPPTQEPIQSTPEIITPQPKPNYLKTIIFSILVVLTLGLIVYLIFQNQKLQKQVLNPPVSPTVQTPSPTPKTVSSISISPNETASWKTYTNTKIGLSLMYPNNWDSFTNKYFENNTVFGPQETIDEYRQRVNNPKYDMVSCYLCVSLTIGSTEDAPMTDEVRNVKEENIFLDSHDAKKYTITYKSDAPYISKGDKLVLIVLKLNNQKVSLSIIDDQNDEIIAIYYKILSTIKFISSNNISSDFDFSTGWYWGSFNQKLVGTPNDWTYQEAGRSSCWHKPGTNCY